MDQIFIYIALGIFGAALGSFAGASVWRLRAQQLVLDKKNKEKVDAKEYARLKKLTGKSFTKDRSQCLSCGYELRWYDLIPIVSWLTLRGKCRSCKKPIGFAELGVELAVAAFFILSYAFWPTDLATGLEITHFGLWLVAGVIMAILFLYDLRWFLLPDKLTIALSVVGLAIVGVTVAGAQDAVAAVLTALGSVAILAGLYAVLHFVSRGRWVGFGDVKLGLGLALILADWQLAIVALFLANFLGCLIVIPLLASKKLQRNAHIPFGPLLIAGTVIAWFVGRAILDGYLFSIGI